MARHTTGRHFLQIPGPTNIPDRVLRAIDMATMDHRSADFAALVGEVLLGLKAVFRTEQSVVIYPASGTGAWEAALVNTLSAGDRILMAETGHFGTLWKSLAEKLGLTVTFLPGDWRHAVNPDEIEAHLTKDTKHDIRAVCIVHNETSTGVVSDIAAIRRAIDKAGHPALLMVDTVSSLASIDYRHDEWGVDVTVASSQKGLMLPPGLSFNAISQKAQRVSASARLPRAYWRWQDMLANNKNGHFPYTPATNLLYGLREALLMLKEEGLENVFKRHARLAQATRRAALGWGLEILCQQPDAYSNSLTAIVLPDGCNADALREIILRRFNMSLGTGLGQVARRVFRIGHLGDFNDLMLAGALAGVEMGLSVAQIPHRKEGLKAALDYLSENT